MIFESFFGFITMFDYWLLLLKNYNILLNFETQHKSVQNNGKNRLVYMKFDTVYPVIGTQLTVYTIDNFIKVFMEKMLGGTLAPMAHLPQIPL